jgi:hypothetical protein
VASRPVERASIDVIVAPIFIALRHAFPAIGLWLPEVQYR